MPIRTLPSRAIADASIQAVDIASNSISKAKIDADTRLGLQNDSIILDGTDGASANKGDFLVLDGTDNSSTNADDRILFDETFVDKIGLFNINTLGSGGEALKVNSAGSAFEFGTAGTFTLLNETTLSASVDVQIQGLMTGYKAYKCIYKLQRSTNLIPRLYFMSGASILSFLRAFLKDSTISTAKFANAALIIVAFSLSIKPTLPIECDKDILASGIIFLIISFASSSISEFRGEYTELIAIFL